MASLIYTSLSWPMAAAAAGAVAATTSAAAAAHFAHVSHSAKNLLIFSQFVPPLPFAATRTVRSELQRGTEWASEQTNEL